MKATDLHTWKDTVGCAAVLLAILLGTLSGAYIAYTDSAPLVSISSNTEA